MVSDYAPMGELVDPLVLGTNVEIHVSVQVWLGAQKGSTTDCGSQFDSGKFV